MWETYNFSQIKVLTLFLMQQNPNCFSDFHLFSQNNILHFDKVLHEDIVSLGWQKKLGP